MQLEAYTALFLRDETGRIVALKRANWKKVAPGQVTGIGGKVEQTEFTDIDAAMFREVQEEINITAAKLQNVKLKGTAYLVNKGDTDCIFYYYTAEINSQDLEGITCTEGDLLFSTHSEFLQHKFIRTIEKCKHYIWDDKVERFSCIFDHKDEQAITKVNYFNGG